MQCTMQKVQGRQLVRSALGDQPQAIVVLDQGLFDASIGPGRQACNQLEPTVLEMRAVDDVGAFVSADRGDGPKEMEHEEDVFIAWGFSRHRLPLREDCNCGAAAGLPAKLRTSRLGVRDCNTAL